MKTHPIAKMFPMLEDAEMAALAADIKTHGLRDPVWTYEDKVLDGRNRVAACEIAGVAVKTREFKGTHAEAIDFVWSENFYRRHLTSSQAGMATSMRKALDPEFMRDVVEPLREEAKGRMNAAGVHGSEGGRGKKKTPVGKRPQGKEKTRDVLAKMHGSSAKVVATTDRILAADPQRAQEVLEGKKSAGRAMREITEEAKRADDAKTAKEVARRLKKDQAPVVYHEPFTRTAERIQDNSVALIFTDPPYDTGSVPLYGDLANVASRVLVDGGSLICYCGHRLIPKIIDAMRPSGLSFYWILACIHSGSYARMPLTGQIVTWKPMLWWAKGKDRRDTASMLNDSVVSDAPDKKTHAWQQGITEALYYIEKLTKEGELVFEPFCGGGTTVVAARRLRRLTIACDIEATAVAAATKRIEEETAS